MNRSAQETNDLLRLNNLLLQEQIDLLEQLLTFQHKNGPEALNQVLGAAAGRKLALL